MYIVKIDNEKVFDPRIDELTLIEPVVELEENNAGSFSFIIYSTHPFYNKIKRRKSIVTVYEDADIIFQGMVYELEEDFYKNKRVYCEGELSYLNDSVQRPAEYHDMTVRGLLETYINNHNAQVEQEKQFKLGMVTVHDSNNSIFCFTNMETTIECIKEDLIDDYGGIIRVRYENGDKYIDYITEKEVNTNDHVIRLGENLIDYKSNINSLDIATAIIPLGSKLDSSPIESLDMRLDIKSVNNGLDYVYDPVAVNTFGWIYKTVIWDNVNDTSILKNKGEKYLSDIQFDKLVIEIKAVELSLRLSEQIRIVSKPHGLKDKYFRLTKQTINLNNPENNTITLGKEEHISLSAQTVQANNDILKAMESITPASTILKQAKKNASALINGNGENGYVVLHENENGVVYEILVMDTPDINTATRVWRWNQKGLGYANSKDANGDWIFGLAMTIDGEIVADYITTGRLVGLEINNGNGTFKVDSSGNMIATKGTFSGSLNAATGTFSGELSAATGTITDGNGTLSISGGDLRMCNSNHGGPGVFVNNADNSLYACWGARNSAALADGAYREVPTMDVIRAGENASDKRLKKDIKDLNNDLAQKLIMAIKPKTFKFKTEPNELNFGVIAQDIREIENNIGIDTENNRLCYTNKASGMYSVDYSQLIAPLISVVQNLYKQVEKLTQERSKN